MSRLYDGCPISRIPFCSNHSVTKLVVLGPALWWWSMQLVFSSGHFQLMCSFSFFSTCRLYFLMTLSSLPLNHWQIAKVPIDHAFGSKEDQDHHFPSRLLLANHFGFWFIRSFPSFTFLLAQWVLIVDPTFITCVDTWEESRVLHDSLEVFVTRIHTSLHLQACRVMGNPCGRDTLLAQMLGKNFVNTRF